MSFSLSSKSLGAMLAVITAALIGSGAVRADDKSEKIQFSDPNSSAGSTNQSITVNPGLDRLNPSSGLKRMQDDLFRPLANSVESSDSLDASSPLPAPRQPRRAVPDKHQRELMERRRNWAFTGLDDLYPETSADEMLGIKQYGPDGKEKVPQSLIEKYIDGLGRKDTGKSKNDGDDANSLLSRFSGTNGFQMLTQPFSDPDQILKDKYSPGAKSGSSENAFSPNRGQSGGAASAESDATLATLAMKKRLDDFRRLLDPGLPPATPVNSLSAVMPYDFKAQMDGVVARATGLSKTNTGFGGFQSGEPSRSSISPLLGVLDPNASAFRSHVNDDPTAYRMGMPNPLAIKVTPVTPARMEQNLQRMLDPFAASIIKPKF